MSIIAPLARISVILLGISITLAIIITVTRYLVGMFTELPFLMILGVFNIFLVIVFFLGGLDG